MCCPIGRGEVKQGGFVCAVSGKRRGKGSSREQSPYAEMCAGINLVIAENIERIYKQNCQNLGLLTSTNFSLIDKIRGGEEIPLAEFTAGEDEITRQVIEYGGLFPVQRGAPAEKSISCRRSRRQASHDHCGKNLRPPHAAIRRKWRDWRPRPSSGAKLRGVDSAVKPGDTGFARADLRFSHEYVTPMAAIFFERYVGKDARSTIPRASCFSATT